MSALEALKAWFMSRKVSKPSTSTKVEELENLSDARVENIGLMVMAKRSLPDEVIMASSASSGSSLDKSESES